MSLQADRVVTGCTMHIKGEQQNDNNRAFVRRHDNRECISKTDRSCGAGREFLASDHVPEITVGLCHPLGHWDTEALCGVLPCSVML